MENSNEQQMPSNLGLAQLGGPMQGAPQAMQPGQNPLAGHFRMPKIHLQLPSGGKWWKPGSLELPVTGEVPIYAMSAKDEILLRTPDGLMNGSAVKQVIEHCCPSIKDAWGMPSVDTDAILIAIRIATFGEQMDINIHCPSCNEENSYGVDLGNRLAQVHIPDYDTPVAIDDLEYIFHPQTYNAVTRLNKMRFTQDRIAQLLSDNVMSDEEKTAGLTKNFGDLVDISIDNLVESTKAIRMPDGSIVTHKPHIKEYYNNAESRLITKLNEKLVQFADQAGLGIMDLKCQHCEHEFQNAIEFDYANFFDEASSS
jgi:hypothetical protein